MTNDKITEEDYSKCEESEEYEEYWVPKCKIHEYKPFFLCSELKRAIALTQKKTAEDIFKDIEEQRWLHNRTISISEDVFKQIKQKYLNHSPQIQSTELSVVAQPVKRVGDGVGDKTADTRKGKKMKDGGVNSDSFLGGVTYYSKTDEWLENSCGDLKCEYCTNRPEKHECKEHLIYKHKEVGE